MLIPTWLVVRPFGICAGHEMIAGIRSPPSSSSVFLPVKGQVSAKRSPPLSLVKMTIVFSAIPFAWIASTTRPTCKSRSSIML